MKNKPQQRKFRLNESIRALELRIIDDEGGSLGVMTRADALAKAGEQGLDLIEIAPDAKPPVAKIVDYGKFQYEQKKKLKELRANTKTSEVKNVQIKTGTSSNDLELKAKRASEWLDEGHRLQAELYLRGRAKYMDKAFLEERLTKFLGMMSVPYKIVEDFRKSPKGLVILVERGKTNPSNE